MSVAPFTMPCCAAMVRLLMEAGADTRKGIYPHRDATSAFALARDREYHEITAVIEEEERLRREEMSCPNATVSPVQDRINDAIAHFNIFKTAYATLKGIEVTHMLLKPGIAAEVKLFNQLSGAYY